VTAALVAADAWVDAEPAFEVAWRVPGEPLVIEPGLARARQRLAEIAQHARREQPYLMAVLAAFDPTAILVRGYVREGSISGFGARLHAAYDGEIPVIAAAPAFIEGVGAEEVRFGDARVYVTALGIPVADAAARVRSMHVGVRLPVLIERVDALAGDAAAGD